MNLQEKVETKAPELRLDQKGKTKSRVWNHHEKVWVQTQLQGRGRVQSPGRPGNFVSVADRSTGKFNSRMAVVPRTGSASPALGFRTIIGVDNRGLLAQGSARAAEGCSSDRQTRSWEDGPGSLMAASPSVKPFQRPHLESCARV